MALPGRPRAGERGRPRPLGAALPLGDVRAAFESIARRIVDLGDGLVDLRRREDPAPLPPPCLLGAFDPLLLGWASREAVIGDHKDWSP